MLDSAHPRRWPAYTLAVLFLGYSVGKAAFALQARLGFPGGPPVPAAEAQRYFMDAAVAQWIAAGSGVVAACVVLATVTRLGRKVPRALMLLALAVMLPAVGAGAAIMIVDGFVGIGVGWKWYHGVLGIFGIGLFAETCRSYMVGTRRVAV
ncbi:hypothetical protein ACQP25_21425 [Microtetraspora malaysiensis]|uniref:hypothetical protein n=1 Tax=Microtetraspora malaysiensis TaxID=161358 RepID=UPI003D8BAD2A